MSKASSTPGFALEETTIETIHRAMKGGQLTVRELVSGYLDRIACHDQQGAALNAVVSINPQALAEADALDQRYRHSGQLQGALHGIPVLLKDNIDTVEVPTSYGSVAFADHEPPRGAW